MDPESAQGRRPIMSALPGLEGAPHDSRRSGVVRLLGLHLRFASSADHLRCLKQIPQAAGLMFWLMLKKFVGSYFFFTWVRRA